MSRSFCIALRSHLITIMLVLATGLPLGESLAAEQTGRISLSGMLGKATVGNQTGSLGAHQQSLRLMWQGSHSSNVQWQFHAKTSHQFQRGFAGAALHSSQWFRHKPLSGDWFERNDHDSSAQLSLEIDRAFYEYRFNKLELRIGRQSIDWGSGRFWQPLNVFGAFAPAALDTEYKPGVDALVTTWYPSEFSTLTAAYVFSPARDEEGTEHSVALHYRNRVGEQTELSFLAVQVLGNDVLGAALESEWQGMGWRLEASYQDVPESDDVGLFVVAGVDYQFENGTTVMAEWYGNDFGASKASELTTVQTHTLFQHGLLPHLSKRVFAVSASREVMPLLKGQYTVLASRLDDDNSLGGQSSSLLHQLNLTYSLSNESELLFSLSVPNGKGLGLQGQLQSEFGHLPASAVLQYRRYF